MHKDVLCSIVYVGKNWKQPKNPTLSMIKAVVVQQYRELYAAMKNDVYKEFVE